MKRLRFLLALLLGIMAPQAWAADGDEFKATTVEGVEITYKVISETDKTCQVGTGSFSASYSHTGSITIPDEVNGYSVVEVAAYAFAAHQMSSCVLPEGITRIGEQAFTTCYHIQSMHIPASVVEIGGSAFIGCPFLVSVDLPAGLITIGSSAFRSCTALKTINLPALTEIPDELFMGCTALESIALPATLTSLGARAFYGCTSLTTVSAMMTLPPSIMEDVFSNRANATLCVPEGCQVAYEAAPYWQEFLSIEEVVRKARSADGVAFSYRVLDEAAKTCELIEGTATVKSIADDGSFVYLSVPSTLDGYTVVRIGEDCFNGTSGMHGIGLPATLTSIGARAFMNASVGGLVIPEAVTSIGEMAFYHAGVPSVKLPSTLTTIGNGTFSNTTLQSIEFPATLKTIGAYAFEGCTSLENVQFPAGLESIGERAFRNCDGLGTVLILGSKTTMDTETFYQYRVNSRYTVSRFMINQATPPEFPAGLVTNVDLAVLFVPVGSKAAYEAADEWKNFSAIIETDMSTGSSSGSGSAEAGDVDGDGEVTLKDVTKLVNIILKK